MMSDANPTRQFYLDHPYPGRFLRKLAWWDGLPRPLSALGSRYWGVKLLRRRKYRRVFGAVIEASRRADGSPIRVLDAGCGTGEESFRLAGAFPDAVSIDAFDLSDESLRAAAWVHERIRTIPGLDQIAFRKGNVLEPIPGEFDVIISNGVLHHTGNTELGLRNLAGAMATNGFLYLYLYSRLGWLQDDAQRDALRSIASLEGGKLEHMGETAARLGVGSQGVRWQGRSFERSASWIDCFTNPHVERFSIRDVFGLLERVGLVFYAFHPDRTLEPEAHIGDRELAGRLASFVPIERYSIMEQLLLPEGHGVFARKRAAPVAS